MTGQSPKIKICGLSTPDAMTAALEGGPGYGADFVGLVFHPASPRHVEIEVAAYLASYVPDAVKVVGLFVSPDDQTLDQILKNVRLDMIQLHGNETPDRVAEIKNKYARPVIKALSITAPADVSATRLYKGAADWLLLDAKGTAEMPGGGGRVFDWALLDHFKSPCPWLLAGGLTPENVMDAITRTRPSAVDVSSGVESMRGIKDPAKIRAFIRAIRGA